MKLRTLLEEESLNKYFIVITVPFADKENIKNKLNNLEFNLNQNSIKINRIKVKKIYETDFILDVRVSLLVTTKLKRAEVEGVIEPTYKIEKIVEK